MKRNQQIIVGGAIVAGALALVTWGAWRWFGTEQLQNRVESIVLSDKAALDRDYSLPPVMVQDTTALKLVPASQPWTGISQKDLNDPEPPPSENEIICPAIETLTIFRDEPDKNERRFMSTRSIEMSGLMKFDVSKLPKPPIQAMFKATVCGIENVGGYRSPARILLFRMKTDWDDSVCYRFANARDRVPWKSGTFSLRSDQDIDLLAPVAKVEVLNPPHRGFNIQVDITPVVAGWVNKEFPNYGLLVTNTNGGGYTNQAIIAGRSWTKVHYPQIVCTYAEPVTRDIPPAPAPEAEPRAIDPGLSTQTVLFQIDLGMQLVQELPDSIVGKRAMTEHLQRSRDQVQALAAEAVKTPDRDIHPRLGQIVKGLEPSLREHLGADGKRQLERSAMAAMAAMQTIAQDTPELVLSGMQPLNLSAEVSDKIKAILEETRKEMAKPATSGPNVDIETRLRQLSKALKVRQSIHELLTPQQRQQWRDLLVSTPPTRRVER